MTRILRTVYGVFAFRRIRRRQVEEAVAILKLSVDEELRRLDVTVIALQLVTMPETSAARNGGAYFSGPYALAVDRKRGT